MDPDIKQLTSTMQNCNYFCTNLIIQLEIRYVMNIWVEFPGLLSHRVIGWTKVSIRTWKIFLLSFLCSGLLFHAFKSQLHYL